MGALLQTIKGVAEKGIGAAKNAGLIRDRNAEEAQVVAQAKANEKAKTKKYIIIGIVIVALVIVIGFMIWKVKK